MKAQTTQYERMKPRAIAGGSGTGVAVVVAWALGAIGVDPDPELVALISGVLVAVFGLIVSRLGK